ncbi:MAG: hypothetical protein M5R40_22480 [Anaerolineae bacterium]|nr:hypothetical protein [Anaerolineae bacterium]
MASEGRLRRCRLGLRREIGEGCGERAIKRTRGPPGGAHGAARFGALPALCGQQRSGDLVHQGGGKAAGVVGVRLRRRDRLGMGDGGGVLREPQRGERAAQRKLV